MKIIEINELDGKVNIAFENGCKLELDDEEYYKSYLYERNEIDALEYEKISQNTSIKKARVDAIKFISYKIRSCLEVFRKLQDLGYDEDIIVEALEGLKTDKYLDDEDYAGRFTRTKIKTKTISKKQLEFELVQRGISQNIIDTVLETNTIDEYTDALKIARKKIANQPFDNKTKLKAMKHLYSKGYSTELINRIMNDLDWNEDSNL